MKKSLFLSLIVGLCAFAACSEQGLKTAEDQAFKPVANADFVISSGTTTFVNTLGTKADPNLEPVVTKGSVEANLSVCEVENKQYVASKTSLHIRTGNDVTVFLPVAASAFSADDKSAVMVYKETHDRSGGWGENSAYFEINAYGNVKKVEAKVEYIAEGIKITVTGVDDELAAYLWEGYQDGLTVEVWNYFKDISLDDLKNGFDSGATIAFSTEPDSYVNAFAKIPDYLDVFDDALTSEDRGGLLFPVFVTTGEDLATDYWVRPLGSYYYLLKGHKNPYDCVVKPADDTIFSDTQIVHDASIPDDVESVFYVIANDYDVIYTK
ncbi:MAG: hypothetical protein SPK80_10090 [Bacteroidales bacterium]|jgi:hypothetical protein|nr:hypothetical protein [Bacteroidales bacterium]